jgi:hypothetical protein
MDNKDNKDNKEEIPLIDKNDVENVFTDLIQLNVNNETVKIRLAVKNTVGNEALVSHNIIMTLPHFLRFADICAQSATNILTQIKKQQKEEKL